MHKIRKFLNKFGLDIHRYRPEPDIAKFWQNIGINTILDIGANVGQFATEIRSKLPNAQIYSFEPLKECFEALETSFGADPKFKAFNYALGEAEVEIAMHKSAYSPSSSILAMSQTHKTLFPHTKEHTEEKIKIKKLDDVARDLNLEKEILIKVDVQGFEDRVIAGGENTFQKGRAVIMETSFVELYENQPTFDDLYQKLKSLGFEYRGSLQQKIDKNTGGVISEDSMFIRKKF